MGTFDVYNRITGAPALVPTAARTTSANGTAVDMTAYNANGLTFLVLAGTITDGTHTFSLQDSPDNSTWTNVASPFIQQGATVAFTSSTTSGAVLKFGYLGLNRYVRLVCTVTGSPATGGFYSAIAVEGLEASLPSA